LPGLQTTLTATGSASPGSLPFTYRWRRDAAILGGILGNTYVADIRYLGNYRVEAIDAKGCIRSSPVVSITDSVSTRLFIVTNPTSGPVTIYYHNPGGAFVKRSISIYNSAGAMVLQNEVTVSGAYPIMLYSLKSLSQGMYVVVLRDETGRVLAREKLVLFY
jgi:hypothetical protein